MTQKPRSEYLSMRREFEPTSERVKLVIVAESPPLGGKYFYDASGEVTEPLFRALMRELGYISLKTKSEGLRKIKQRGWVLVDATYEQVNALDGRTRDRVILRDYSQLCDDLKQLLSTRWKKVPLVLTKANVCRLLEPRLKADGFNVLNPPRHVIPFPSNGQQKNFAAKFCEVVGPSNYRDAEEKMLQFYPPGKRLPMTAVEKQIRQYEIDQLLKDDPEKRARAQKALENEDDAEVVSILFDRAPGASQKGTEG
jgi:hypothetical protein